MTQTQSEAWFKQSLWVAAITVAVVILAMVLPAWLGAIPLGAGLAVLIFLVLHNPARFAIRLMFSVIGMIGVVNVIPAVLVKLDSTPHSLIASFAHENQFLTNFLLTIIFLGLLGFELFAGQHLLPYFKLL